MKSRLLKTIAAGAATCALLATGSITAVADDAVSADTDRGARTCLEGQNNPAAATPTQLNVATSPLS